VAVEKSLLFDYGWAIGNIVAGEIQIFSIGEDPLIFTWDEKNTKFTEFSNAQARIN
jgi:hypothetical protein